MISTTNTTTVTLTADDIRAAVRRKYPNLAQVKLRLEPDGYEMEWDTATGERSTKTCCPIRLHVSWTNQTTLVGKSNARQRRSPQPDRR